LLDFVEQLWGEFVHVVWFPVPDARLPAVARLVVFAP
jgi:hypothetical protein